MIRACQSADDGYTTAAGCNQCKEGEQMCNKCALAQTFFKTRVIWSSPLTRALQTCLIGLDPLLEQQQGGDNRVFLKPCAREKHNVGGQDTTGQVFGDEIKTRALVEMRRHNIICVLLLSAV